MKTVGTLLLLALVAATPEIRYFHYERPVENLPVKAEQACMAVDAGIMAHSAPRLVDLRLYRDGVETPYVTHLATPEIASQGTVQLLNKGVRAGKTTFEAGMPGGHFSDVELDITAHDFIATVTVTGSLTDYTGDTTTLGSYTIFDLTKQRLGRSTVLHLPESDFKYLHFTVTGPLVPEMINGVTVVRLPASQPKYVTVAESAQVTRKGRDSVVEFTVPPFVPVDRVLVTPGEQPSMFSRDAVIKVEPVQQTPPRDEQSSPQPATASGSLLRVHSVEDGQRIDEERFNLDAPETSFDTPAKWTITINNGDDAPIEIKSVQLQMLERDLCFEAAGSGSYVLYYGDAALAEPVYDYAKLFAAKADAAKVTAGAEIANPAFQARPDERPFTEKHPALLWAALILVIVLLGVIALESMKRKIGRQG